MMNSDERLSAALRDTATRVGGRAPALEPEVVRFAASSRRRRARGTSIVAVLVVVTSLVVGLVALQGGRHSSPAPAVSPAYPLGDSVLVASGLTVRIAYLQGYPPPPFTGPALVAFGGSNRLRVASVEDRYGPWQSEFGTALVGGGAIVIENPAPDNSGGNDGTAVAVRPGATWQESLGQAHEVVAGVRQGTAWIFEFGASSPSTCTIRQVTIDAAVLLGPQEVPCSWFVLGATAGGLLIEEGSSQRAVLWDPTTKRITRRYSFPLPGLTVAADTAVSRTNNYGHHEADLEMFVTHLVSGKSSAFVVRAAPGMAFPWYTPEALSPNGRYLAVEETTLSYDLAQEKQARAGQLGNPVCSVVGVPCGAPTAGLLAVFDVATGALVLQRRLTLVSDRSAQSADLAWSPDGAWILLTASAGSVAAVPTSSATAPIHIFNLTTSPGTQSVGADNFVVTSK